MGKVTVKVNKKNIKKTKENIEKNKSLTIIFLIVFVLITYFLVTNFKKIGIITLSKEDIDYYNYIDIPYEKNTLIERYKNEILIINQNKMYTVNGNGKITWECEINNISDPLVSVEKDYIVLTNKDSSNYHIYKNKKEIVNNEITGKIKQIDINSNGKVCLIYSGEGYKAILEIYDSNSKLILKKPLESDIINNICFSNNDRDVYYTDIEINGTNTNTYLNKINIKDKQKKINNLIREESNMVYKLSLNNNILYLQLTDSIKTISTNKNKSTTSLDWDKRQVSFVDNDENYYSFVYKDNTKSTKDNLEIYNLSNKMVAKVNLEVSPKNYSMYRGVVCVSSDKKIVLYNYFGKIIKEYNSKANITETILFNNGKSLLFKIANKIYIESL